jgi:hypothetical protein
MICDSMAPPGRSCSETLSSRRWRDRHRDGGVSGLRDRRLGPSPLRATSEEIERMLGLNRDLYRGFTVKHFHEQLA